MSSLIPYNRRRDVITTAPFESDMFCLQAVTTGNITITIPATVDTVKVNRMMFTKNGITWDTLQNIDNIEVSKTIAIGYGQKLFIKGTSTGYSVDGVLANSTRITLTCQAMAKGNIMSLLDETDYANVTAVPAYGFANLFYQCGDLLSVPLLPALTVGIGGYQKMFFNDISITQAGGISATQFENYACKGMFEACLNLATFSGSLAATRVGTEAFAGMFKNCSSLTTGPSSVGTTTATMNTSCCSEMFQSTSLVIPPLLPSTDLRNKCYEYMFMGSTITTAPNLNANNVPVNAYQFMFQGCRNLTTTATMEATSLGAVACYYMYKDCTSLTTAVLNVSVLSSYCYAGMFSGCTHLNDITFMATDISAQSCLDGWVANVAASGTFRKRASMTSLPTGVNGIPNGWTVIDNV